MEPLEGKKPMYFSGMAQSSLYFQEILISQFYVCLVHPTSCQIIHPGVAQIMLLLINIRGTQLST